MLLALLPSSVVHSTVCPFEFAMAMPPVVFEVTFVSFPVFPLEFALATHFIVDPGPGVFFAICPFVDSMAVDLVISEFTLVNRIISEV